MDSKPEIQGVTEQEIHQKLLAAKEELLNISKTTPLMDTIQENPKTSILAALIAGILVGSARDLRSAVEDEVGKQAVKAAVKRYL